MKFSIRGAVIGEIDSETNDQELLERFRKSQFETHCATYGLDKTDYKRWVRAINDGGVNQSASLSFTIFCYSIYVTLYIIYI